MARRRKQGGAEDLMDAVAMLPWWAGVAIAVVAFMVLHMASVAPKPGGMQPGQVGRFAVSAMLSQLAYYGQFLIPPLCLVAALASLLRRRKGDALVAGVTQSGTAQALEGMSWREFEVLVGESFRLRGYKVTARGGGGADGGIDLVLRKDGETYLVQCKQWKAFRVGVEVVRELYGAMTANGAAGGFVVTSGSFTGPAQALAHGRNITLVDGPQLSDMLRQGRRLLDETAPATVPAGSPGDSALPDFAVPHCPACQAAMVLRTARKGSKAGKQFWGCARFPDCAGTRELRAG